ncbi:MAG TPA: paraquat-inducible protein A [Rhizomicrobium sp.]|nr:paraquat-inducible protein A [Rhizomicrobium sp.]
MTIACPDCGVVQDIPRLNAGFAATCRLCRATLETTAGRSIVAALACSLGTFLLLFPANLLPLLKIEVFGITSTNTIAGGVIGLWNSGWILLAGISGMFVVVLPFVRFAILTLVLGTLLPGYRPRWLGAAFRWAVWLDPWAMLDVFLLASFVGYYRLAHVHQAQLFVQAGGMCLFAAALLTMLSRSVLDRRTVWREIAPEYVARAGEKVVSCTVCDMVQPSSATGTRCPRCRAVLHARLPDAIVRTAALGLASLVLFFPANIYPMNISDQLGTRHSYTIFTGIEDLFSGGLWPLGILIFCTSIAIPFGKIVIILWCVWSAKIRSTKHLELKTKLFRAVAELGRWSKTDPYTIVFFVPLMNFGVLASARAGWGATAFVMMTFLSMVASYTFDPRLMWDALGDAQAEQQVAPGSPLAAPRTS